MKQIYLGLLILAVATPALAAGKEYANDRYSFTVTIPPMVGLNQNDSASGDGATFNSKDGSAELKTWGSRIIDGTFVTEVKSRENDEKQDGWTVSYTNNKKAVASYSGTKGDRIFYAHMIPSCEGEVAVFFRLEYPAAQKADFDPAIKELNGSLKSSPGECH